MLALRETICRCILRETLALRESICYRILRETLPLREIVCCCILRETLPLRDGMSAMLFRHYINDDVLTDAFGTEGIPPACDTRRDYCRKVIYVILSVVGRAYYLKE